MSARAAVAAFLAGQGYGVLADSIWVGSQPARTSYPAIVVQRYGGGMIETYGSNEQQPLVQVFLTGTEQGDLEGERLADAMWNACATSGPVAYTDPDGGETTVIQVMRPVSAVLPLGTDAEDRPMFSFNMELTYE